MVEGLLRAIVSALDRNLSLAVWHEKVAQARHQHLLSRIDQLEKQMAADFTTLDQEVTDLTSAVDAIDALLDNIDAQLVALTAEAANGGDVQTHLNQIVEQLRANRTNITAAIVRNTPAAPPAPVLTPTPDPSAPTPDPSAPPVVPVPPAPTPDPSAPTS